VRLHVVPSLDDRNRLTTGFRFILAIPHLLLLVDEYPPFFFAGVTVRGVRRQTGRPRVNGGHRNGGHRGADDRRSHGS
jgi:hypothetical protein